MGVRRISAILCLAVRDPVVVPLPPRVLAYDAR
jgi:hypothetical protein